jgi:hypothetical protein
MTIPQHPLVLLARPHPMIVEQMRHFLTENGYEPLPLNTLETRPEAAGSSVAGGVISTSLASQIQEPVEAVAQRVRGWYPDLPLVVTTLADRHTMARALSRKLGLAIGAPGVIDALEVDPADQRLGRPDHVLLLHRSDLIGGDGSAAIGAVLRRHLAGARV